MCGILSARQQSARGYFLPDAVARYVQLYRQETIISLLLILLMVPFCLLASEDDKATDQRIIQSITILPGALDMKEGTTVQLAAIGHYNSGVERNLTSHVTWSVGNFGIAAVEVNETLRARREGTTTLRASLGNIESEAGVVVYKEINGFRLPPEPDPRVNNSTLLGIDRNNNGVRDDVERYIILYFSKGEYPKTRTALAMQYARATQKIIEDPVIENKKYLDDSVDCQFYWLNKITINMRTSDAIKYAKQQTVFNDTKLNDVIFNTKERIWQDYKFNEACNGHIFPGRMKSIKNCQKNIDELGE